MKWTERTEMLIGEDSLRKLSGYSIAVVGLGGVGAYAAEMFARAGVGSLIIVDADIVSETDKNRQLLALGTTVGRKKTEVMSERLTDINPNINVIAINEYLTEDNIPEVFSGYVTDYMVDAIDTLSPKIALIKYALSYSIPIISSMGAGAKYDATKIRIADISKSFNCPLASILRKRLRKDGIKRGFRVVFSEELPDSNAIVPVEERNKRSQSGTISYLPAGFGIVAAQAVLTSLLEIE